MSNKSSGQQVQYWYHRLEERCIYLCIEEYIPLRIAELCQKRGYTKYRLAQLTGKTGIISQLKMQNEMKLTDESWISYQQGKGNEDTIAQFFSDDESRLDLTKEQKEILEIWDGLDEKEREIFMTFIRSLKK